MEKIYTQKLKVELKDRKMAFDSPRLKAVSGSASLIAGSNLFQISELKLIDDQWSYFLLAVELQILFKTARCSILRCTKGFHPSLLSASHADEWAGRSIIRRAALFCNTCSSDIKVAFLLSS